MPGYFFFFGGYEACRTLMTPTNGRKEDLGPIKTVIAGGIGGVSLWVAIFPFDVVKSRMQIGHHTVTSSSISHGNKVSKQKSMFSVLLDIKRNEGNCLLFYYPIFFAYSNHVDRGVIFYNKMPAHITLITWQNKVSRIFIITHFIHLF